MTPHCIKQLEKKKSIIYFTGCTANYDLQDGSIPEHDFSGSSEQ
jgi:hypothetical protein